MLKCHTDKQQLEQQSSAEAPTYQKCLPCWKAAASEIAISQSMLLSLLMCSLGGRGESAENATPSLLLV